VELSSEGLQTWIGTIVGIAGAVAVGLFFFKGTLRVPLHRFFAATSVILMLVSFQLALTGLHEFERGALAAFEQDGDGDSGADCPERAVLFVFIFGAAALLVLREWQSAKTGQEHPGNDERREMRLLESQNRRQRRWMMAAAIASLTVILVLTADFIYARANSAPPSARTIQCVGDIVRVPVSEVQDGSMHLFSVSAGGQSLRFMIIRKPKRMGSSPGCLPHSAARKATGQDGTERDLPALCFGDLYSVDWRSAADAIRSGVPSHLDGETW